MEIGQADNITQIFDLTIKNECCSIGPALKGLFRRVQYPYLELITYQFRQRQATEHIALRYCGIDKNKDSYPRQEEETKVGGELPANNSCYLSALRVVALVQLDCSAGPVDLRDKCPLPSFHLPIERVE